MAMFLWLWLVVSIPCVATNFGTVARLRLSDGRLKRVLLNKNESMSSFLTRYNINGPIYLNDTLVEEGSLPLVSNGSLLTCKPVHMSATKSEFEKRNTYISGFCSVDAQKDSVSQKISLDEQTFQLVSSSILSTSAKKRRVALLYGTVSNNGSTSVSVVWEPPQPKSMKNLYDAQSVIEAARGSDASMVARSLGFRLVGWMFTHPPRDYILSDYDLMTAATLRAIAAQANASDDFITLAASINKDGKVVMEAYELSNSGYLLASNRTIGMTRSDGTECSSVTSTIDIIVNKRTFRSLDTVIFTVPVPIGTHHGWLHSTFPSDCKDPRASVRHLTRALFSGSDTPTLDHLRDFHLLLYLNNRIPDIAPLLRLVADRRASVIPSYFLTVLRQMCSQGD